MPRSTVRALLCGHFPFHFRAPSFPIPRSHIQTLPTIPCAAETRRSLRTVLSYAIHPCDVTQPAQQLPEPATLPWREIAEIWLIRVVVALAAILEHECCSRVVGFLNVRFSFCEQLLVILQACGQIWRPAQQLIRGAVAENTEITSVTDSSLLPCTWINVNFMDS